MSQCSNRAPGVITLAGQVRSLREAYAARLRRSDVLPCLLPWSALLICVGTYCRAPFSSLLARENQMVIARVAPVSVSRAHPCGAQDAHDPYRTLGFACRAALFDSNPTVTYYDSTEITTFSDELIPYVVSTSLDCLTGITRIKEVRTHP